MACRRYGGEGACPRDTDAPRSEEGATVAALIPVLFAQTSVTMARMPEFDIAMAVRLIEAEGVDAVLAGQFAVFLQAGIRRAQSQIPHEGA